MFVNELTFNVPFSFGLRARNTQALGMHSQNRILNVSFPRKTTWIYFAYLGWFLFALFIYFASIPCLRSHKTHEPSIKFRSRVFWGGWEMCVVFQPGGQPTRFRRGLMLLWAHRQWGYQANTVTQV